MEFTSTMPFVLKYCKAVIFGLQNFNDLVLFKNEIGVSFLWSTLLVLLKFLQAIGKMLFSLFMSGIFACLYTSFILAVKQEVWYIPIERTFMSLWYGLVALISSVSEAYS